MLKELFPQVYTRYMSLPILGSLVDDYAGWMLEQGYPRTTLCMYLRGIARLDRLLQGCGIRAVSGLTREVVEHCWSVLRQRENLSSGVFSFARYLEIRGAISVPPPPPPGPTRSQLSAYQIYLEEVRGFAASTVRSHLATVSELLAHLEYERDPGCLLTLTPKRIEDFVRLRGGRLSRGSLQHEVAHLRGFLRFLATLGDIRPGLETMIDTPRMYRLESLPRSLPWPTVRALLESIDRSTGIGLRDYTMLFLIATYGLRACEIVSLTLDHMHWRSRQIHFPQPKNGASLRLPLTDSAGTALCQYLRHRPSTPQHRQLFLSTRAPTRGLKPHAVGRVFEVWSQRSGLEIPVSGVHCLRHSHAVHLLRRGVTLKAIGDLLGHRTAESTCVYLRLATEDLREVALPVPRLCAGPKAQEVQP